MEMIYFHDEQGNVTNIYSQISGINCILEYQCDRRYSGGVTTKIPSKLIQVACTDDNYANDWINRNELLLPIYSQGMIKYSTPVSCIAYDGIIYTYWSRSYIKIDWNRDYHFYKDKEYSVS